MTISSRDALPALSPIPLMVHSTCLAPACIAARELATARPMSSWQCTLTTASFNPWTCSNRVLIREENSSGKVYPTVSGIFMVVAPAESAARIASHRKLISVRVASSALNSTSSTSSLASPTALVIRSKHSSWPISSFLAKWISEVAMNV